MHHTEWNGGELISQSETLKGGEVITFIVTTASTTRTPGAGTEKPSPSSTRRAATRSARHGGPWKALVVVDSIGLDRVLPATASSAGYFSTGNGCTKTIGDDANSVTAAGPGGSGTYQLDPGSYTGSIHAYARDYNDIPTCDNSALIGNLAIQAVADRTAILLTYAPKDGDIRTLFIPLDE